MKLVLTLSKSETKEQAQDILNEIIDKMEADYPEITSYAVVE